VHGAGFLVAAHVFAGQWGAVRDLTPEVERRVSANLGTPCAYNMRALLWCSLAATVLGDEAESRRLEAAAEALGMTGFLTVDITRVRVALARGNRERAADLVNGLDHDDASNSITLVWTDYLDALSELGHAEAVEDLAPRLMKPGTYFEPFALRAMGRVRGDDVLLDQAASLFDKIGLAWHATETRAVR
jgi:uncharacterized protein HemY